MGEHLQTGHDQPPVFSTGDMVTVQHQILVEDCWVNTPNSNAYFAAEVMPPPTALSSIDDDRGPRINLQPSRPLPDGNPFGTTHPVYVPTESHWMSTPCDNKIMARYLITHLLNPPA
jgi:hypothetical protein